MALMLRKAAQIKLNAADLDPYHADLDRSTKEFKLYTPCGKTFATVAGVLFSNLKPTKEEIDFAIELLEFWLLRNKAVIDDYIAAFTKLQMYGDLPTERGDMSISQNQYYNHEKQRYTTNPTVDVEHRNIIYTLNIDGMLLNMSWKEVGIISMTQLVRLPPAKIADALVFLSEHLDLKKAKNTVDQILADMNTCHDM